VFKYAGVAIRPVEERDLPAMVALRSDPRVWTTLGDITMVNLDRQREWYQSIRASERSRYYVLLTSRIDFLGIVRTDEIAMVNRSMRVGGDIQPRYQGRGYGTRMFRLITKYAFDYLNMNRLWLLVLETNAVGRRLYRNAGFTEEGRQREAVFRNGKYEDYIMMSLLRSEYRGDRRAGR
jgi:RimJ/RimL family protein N-acetyltransferase